MQELIPKENIKIEDLIYEVRGKQVIFDRDLAKLYQCKNGTKDINKAVKRNIERFPCNFYFQLTSEEFESLRFQIGTTNKILSLPYVFTEQGVAMLSSVLHTETAVQTSIIIMNAFVAMKNYLGNSHQRISNIESRLIEYDNLRCQIVTSSLSKNYDGRRYMPYVFTAYGITMLAGILKSDVEFENWKSQFATSNSDKMVLRKIPYVKIIIG